MDCISCGNSSLVFYKENSNKKSIYCCESCNLFLVDISKNVALNDIKDRYKKDFWLDTKYNIEEMIKSDFTNEEGKHFALNWSSMYSYCKKYLLNRKKILEIGTGTGVHLIMFDKLGFSVTGVEPDSKNVHLINQKLTHGKCINVFMEDFERKEKFDVIYLYHSLEHMVRPDLLLKECHSLLQKDGIIIIAVPDCENPDTLKDSIQNVDHLWHFSKIALKKIATSLDYKIERCDSLATIKELNTQRLHRLLDKSCLRWLNKKMFPYWPFRITNSKDGYEIRLIISKSNNHRYQEEQFD